MAFQIFELIAHHVVEGYGLILRLTPQEEQFDRELMIYNR